MLKYFQVNGLTTRLKTIFQDVKLNLISFTPSLLFS